MKDNGLEYNLLKPFGPRIGHFKLDDLSVSKFIELTDNILKDETAANNANNRLAGQVEKELLIPVNLLKENELYDLFTYVMNQYVLDTVNSFKHKKQQLKIKSFMTEMWVNSQFENEYSPVHWHPSCTLSAVFYLKVPKFQKRKVHKVSVKDNYDGRIFFINKSAGEAEVYLENSMVSFAPAVGDLFIWPSRLLHGVYPFIGQDERRSVAFNGVHNLYEV